MLSVSATVPWPGNAASPCSSSGTTDDGSWAMPRPFRLVWSARARGVGAGRAVVVLHVARAALGQRDLRSLDRLLLALELGEDRLVRAADRVRQNVQAT